MSVEPVQMLHEPAETFVGVLLGEMPVEAERVLPLRKLAELDSLEDEFLSRMCPHPREEHPAVGEFLPVVAGHFIDERSLAVNNFVVAENKDEMLLERIQHGKSDFPLVIPAVDGILADVAQAVVHPAHVPFEAKSQAARVGGA